MKINSLRRTYWKKKSERLSNIQLTCGAISIATVVYYHRMGGYITKDETEQSKNFAIKKNSEFSDSSIG